MVHIPKTTTMYHMHTFGSNKCIHVAHSGRLKVGGGFGFTYLTYLSTYMCMLL